MQRAQQLRKEREESEKPPKVVDRFPTRDWNVQDFVGKYHLSKFANKLHPLPGTQVAIEKEYSEDVEAFAEHQRRRKEEQEQRLRVRLKVKEESASLQTKVLFETVLGSPIARIEEVLREKEALLDRFHAPQYRDSAAEIDRFWKSCQQGKAHYVGYAVSNGFSSVDYQHPDSGDCALHLAVRSGDLELTEELLKYKAYPDVCNRLGNYPIHEVWGFWNTDPTQRTKEEREEQEELTCQLLLTLLSYNAFVDALNFHKETALHIACRIGTVRAVKILLTFRADLSLRSKYGESPVDLAREFQQDESRRLLLAWEHIQPHFVHTDFHVIWRHFLSHYEEEMKESRPAAVILSEWELEKNAKLMARMGRAHRGKENDVSIDDPLLHAACLVAKKDNDVAVPKPWEKGWKKYVKQMKSAGAQDLKTRLTSLQGKLQASHEKDNEMMESKESRAHTALMKNRRLQRRLFPDLPKPLTWEKREQLKKEALAKLIADESSDEDNEDTKKDKQEQKGDESSTRSVSLFSDVLGAPPRHLSEEELFYSRDPTESALTRRRKHAAQRVCLDAKFLKFTRRLATDSALLIPQRSPQAPLKHTEEEGSILRLIASQGAEYDLAEKRRPRNKLEDMFGIAKSPQKNSIGAYCEEIELTKAGERERLMGSLSSQDKSVAEILHRNERLKNSKVDLEQQAKMDLVNDKRPRYVDARLLPEIKRANRVEDIIRMEHERQEVAELKKRGLLSKQDQERAKAEMQAEIAEEQSKASVSNETEQEKLHNDQHDHVRDASDKGRYRSMQHLFLEKPKVNYGAGRLTSSHNMKGKIEEPWTTVGGRYKTSPGDRTA